MPYKYSNGRGTNSGDEPYYSQGYDNVDFPRWYFITKTHTWTKNPVYEYPQHEEDIHKTCDVVGAFYDVGAQFFNAYVGAYEAFDTAMWLTEPGVLPTRTKIGEAQLSSDNNAAPDADNLLGYSYLGKIVLHREFRHMTFVPA